jgi:crotonobetainyl-CoA:carnitine CoA-transferase CaiB-like acyl-CoA transferase
MSSSVLISEVGPRDGLQSVDAFMPTVEKKAWISALYAAGVREIEVSSFVPARLLPQLADAAEVVEHALSLPGLTVMALVPNLRGAQAAVAAGVHKLTIPVSASQAHSMANVRKSREQMIEEVAQIVAYRNAHAPRVHIEANVATAFGCTIQGEVPEDEVVELACALVACGADETGLSDTTGYANPAQIRRLFRRVRQAIGHKLGAAHLHNTRGLGLANCLAAYEEGVRTFDSSQAGLGGCPYAPGASGNVVTEDLVFMFESMGVKTGIDLNRLMQAREILKRGLPGEPLYGMLPDAGLPKTFIAASTDATPDGASDDVSAQLPLAGIRVLEFSHMVMGPTCGLVLADLGAEVIKLEPIEGDSTRQLLGSGSGFFPLFNRNKKSIAVNLKHEEGRAIVEKLLGSVDVVIENFKQGTLDKFSLGAEQVRMRHPRLVYASLKGFLAGPYEHRTALDEVVQMMGGLAYMTGRKGDPLRAGSSVNDIMGGMFAAIAILAALREREQTGQGQLVQSALFENNVFLVAQHMMQFAMTGKPAAPMPNRISAWGIYDVFTVRDQEQIFLAVVSDTQWKIFCDCFGFESLYQDPLFKTNHDRVRQRERLMPILRERLSVFSASELAGQFEAAGLPFAPIEKPEHLFEDPHLLASGGLVPMQLPDGRPTQTVLLPIAMNGRRLGLRNNPPALGADAKDLLQSLGFDEASVMRLQSEGVLNRSSMEESQQS